MEENKKICPFEIKDIEPELSKELQSLFNGPRLGYICVGPKRFLFGKDLEPHIQDIYNMKIKPSDVFVTSYMRSGTTWTQELVWLVANNLNYATAGEVSLLERYTLLERRMYMNDYVMEKRPKNDTKYDEYKIESTLKVLEMTTEPRFIKSHLPFSMLPPDTLDTAKVVYIARDPRDVAVSAYHFSILFKMLGFSGNFKQFWNLFINDKILMTPYFEHVKEAWARRHHSNMLFIFYEEMLLDLAQTIRKVLNFFNKEFTDEQITRLCDHLSIENFKTNSSVNLEFLQTWGVFSQDEKFIRKGKAGGWREYFDEEMTLQADRWITDNLRDTDLRYPSFEGKFN